MKTIICLFLLFSANLSFAEAKKEECGQLSFSKSITCDKPEVYFDISKCDQSAYSLIPAAKAVCSNGEMTVKLKHGGHNYTGTLAKSIDGTWSQIGPVLKSKSKSGGDSASEVVKPSKAKVSHKDDTKQASKVEVKEEIKADSKSEVKAEEPKKEEPKTETKVDPWKFTFGGFASIEYESSENFGDSVAANFNNADANSSQTNANLLSNLEFTAAKENIKFDTLLEIGEVFFGDTTTGGNEGLRAKIIELRNFSFEEKYDKNWYFKTGLWSVNADPRGFVLSDHHAGVQIRYENDNTNTQLWVAKATDSAPTTHVVADTYVGLSRNHKLNDNANYTIFATQRTTRESFVDTDLVTPVTGASSYLWLGVNAVQNQILASTNLELNLIGNQSQFKTDHGGPTDSNTGWLAHFRLDRELVSDWSVGLDGLGTSGSSDSRVGGVKVLGKRKNFNSPDPSQSYLLTIATSDSADDAAGSPRGVTANQIARLDMDEGMKLAVLSVSHVFNEKWDALVRYGQIQSASENATTQSSDYGSEIDLKIKFKASANTSWLFEAGQFNPGKFFVNQDNATLLSTKYRVDF